MAYMVSLCIFILMGYIGGLYNIVQRPDHTFAADYFNVNQDEWYAFNHGGNINVSLEEARALF